MVMQKKEQGDERRLLVKKWKRAGLYILILNMFLTMIVTPGLAETDAVQAGESNAEQAQAAINLEVQAAYLIEAETGQVIYAYNDDVLRQPASMVKMMTEYLVLEHVHSGKMSWDNVVTISEYAAAIPGSGGLLAQGHQYTVKDLFRQMSIYSANDATVALAEQVAGTEEQFVALMNDKAREFGLSEGAYFTNATGLNKEDTGKYTPNVPGESLFTASDSATIARRLIVDFPEVLEFTKIPRALEREDDPKSHWMNNWNWMLEGWKEFNNYMTPWAYEGLDGLKTGYTKEAGWNFTGTAERNGMRLISVVMGTTSEERRFGETRKLLDYGFNNFEKKTMLPARSAVEELKTVDINKGVETKVDVVTEKGIELIVKKGTTTEQFTLTAEPVAKEERVAPIEKGQVLGTAKLSYEGTDQPGLKDIEVNLVATDDVEKAGWFRLLFRAIKDFFVDLFQSIKNIF